MAYLVERKDGRIEIRESVSTPAGPRARTLAVFRGGLTPDVLERAAGRALRPFDATRVEAAARARGIPVVGRREDRLARELLRALRSGNRPSPPVCAALGRALEADEAESALDPELAEVVEWIGVGLEERGRVLRELLRTYDRILAHRRPRPLPARKPFPRFRSRPGRGEGGTRRRGEPGGRRRRARSAGRRRG